MPTRQDMPAECLSVGPVSISIFSSIIIIKSISDVLTIEEEIFEIKAKNFLRVLDTLRSNTPQLMLFFWQ